MAVAAQPRAGGSALRVGVTTGLIIGVASLPVTALRVVGGGGVPLLLLFFVIACAAFLIAGILATRRSCAIGSGALAGLIAGVVAAFIAVCIGIVLILVLTPQFVPVGAAGGHGSFLGAAARRRSEAVRLEVARELIAGVLLIVAGVVFGLIGGLLGRIGRRPPAAVPAPPASPVPGFAQPFIAPSTPPVGAPYVTPTPSSPPLYTAPTDYLPAPDPGYSTYPTATAYTGDEPTTYIPPQPPQP